MSKLRLGLSTVFMFILLGIFSAVAFAATSDPTFVPTSTNPAPNIHVADVDNNGNPGTQKTHGNFQNNTNSCANCHSVHNGGNSQLLMKSGDEYDLCMSCHDGTMGFYNVDHASGAGIFNSTQASASMHEVKSAVKVNSAPGSYNNQAADTQVLECSSCHNPHGSVNDRLLNENVINGAPFAFNTVNNVKTPVTNGTKTINLDLKVDNSTPELTALNAATGGLIKTSNGPLGSTDKTYYSQFCGSCHNDYLASRSSSTTQRPSNVAKTAAGDTSHYSYTHTTNSTSQGRGCYSCHYAHGTDITTLMDTQGKKVADYVAQGWSEEKAEAYMKDVNTKDPSTGLGGSNLKKYTNMVVCWTCHQSTHKIITNPVDPSYLDSTGVFKGKATIK